MCGEADVHLEFLPPYSPDYNPKNYMLAETYDSFDQFLEAGMRYMSRKPGNHFRSCHIDINT